MFRAGLRYRWPGLRQDLQLWVVVMGFRCVHGMYLIEVLISLEEMWLGRQIGDAYLSCDAGDDSRGLQHLGR